MIRRPLNEQFADKVFAGIKTTTIRDNPWPAGKPIMLFRWEGKPYRSKQVEIAPVIVEETEPIGLWLDYKSGRLDHSDPMGLGRPLWQCEGFNSFDEMDAWFRCKMLPGQTVTKALMRFRLATPDEVDACKK
ncbi:MAG: hypothetical protein EBS38_08170 [Actinobacteria bacterium]|nr:hypothetical protein [Actinomycetota bacterium]